MKSNLTTTVSNEQRAARKVNVATWNKESMDILIRAEGVELNEKLREAVNRKIGRVRQYAPRAMRARVQLRKLRANPSPQQFRAKVHYEIPGNDLFAEHTAHDPVAAIDLVAEKIEGRLR